MSTCAGLESLDFLAPRVSYMGASKKKGAPNVAVSANWGSMSWLSVQQEPCYFGVYIRVPDFWETPAWTTTST